MALALLCILANATPSVAATATIQGVVTDEQGAPIPQTCVELHVAERGYLLEWRRTDPSGRYSFGFIDPGSYVLYFAECFIWETSATWAPEWNGDVYRSDEAEPIVVDHLETATVDATLGRGARVRGGVADIAGTPIEEICVQAHPTNRDPWGYHHVGPPVLPLARTLADGTYEISGAAPGSHRISFRDCRHGEEALYVKEYYPNAPIQDAALVLELPDGITSGIDEELELGATVHGTVTGPDGAPVDDACVTAYDTHGHVRASARTWYGDGIYRLEGVPPHDARIGFEPCYRESRADAEYHPGVRTLEAAERLSIGSGNELRVDASLTECETYRDSDGDGLQFCEEMDRGTWDDSPDSDGDRLSDGDEVYGYGTSPADSDTDGDLFADGTEVLGSPCLTFSAKSDPLDPTSTPANPDGAGAPPPPATLPVEAC